MERSKVLEETVNDITGFLNAQYAALTDVVIEMLAEPMYWQGQGMTSMRQWLAWRCGVSTATADKIVLIAERASELPVTFAAFQRGELSLEQTAAVARRAPGWADAQACGYATRMTVRQLQRTMNYPFPEDDSAGADENAATDAATASTAATDAGPAASHDNATAEPNASTERESVGTATTPPEPDEWFSHVFDDGGVFRLSIGTDYETGHILMAALSEARDALFQGGDIDVTWAEAFREVANRSLDSVGDPNRRSRFNINLYIDTSITDHAATDDRTAFAGQMVDAAGWNVPDAIRRHLTCDGTITPIIVENGSPVSVGRSQRIVPDRTRRIIERRDHGCCAVPGCSRTQGLEVHHIIHWEHDGPTDTWNLVLICRHHHRQHHRHRLGIAGNADRPDGLTFTDQYGRPIRQSGAMPRPPSGAPPQPESRYEHPLGEGLETRWLHFNPPSTDPARRRAHFLAQQRRRNPELVPSEHSQRAS